MRLQRDHGGGLHQALHLLHFQPVADLALGDVAHQRHLVDLRRIVDLHLQQEAVELRLGQRVGAFLLDRVLRGEHHEGRLHLVRLAFDGDLRLLHHLEQRGLGLCRRAVDLVGEQQVDEHRPAPRGEHLVLRVVERVAGDVGGHEIGRELDAPEGSGDGARQRLHQQRLAQAGHALDQHMAAGEQRAEHRVDHFGLTDERLARSRRASPPRPWLPGKIVLQWVYSLFCSLFRVPCVHAGHAG